MTSFGIEWDTQALVFVENQKKTWQLPEKGTVYQDGKMKITTEDWSMLNYIDATDYPDSCKQTLEFALGVFYDDKPNSFNIDEFQTVCDQFRTFWYNLINSDDKSFLINRGKFKGSRAHVLTYANHKTSVALNREVYSDCGSKNPGGFTAHRGDIQQYWAYIKGLERVIGKPQVTIGFELHRFTYLMRSITQLYTYVKDFIHPVDSPLLDVIVKSVGLEEQFTTGVVDLDLVNTSDFTSDMKAFILMFVYYVESDKYFTALRENNPNTYKKAIFTLKPRTNLAFIYYNMFDETQRGLLLDWMLYYSLGDTIADKLYEQLTSSMDVHIGQVFTSVPDNAEIAPLGIYTLSPSQLEKFKGQYRDVRYIPAYIGAKAPGITDNYKYNDIDELLGFDIGEWYSPDNNTIVIELRGFDLLLRLVRAAMTDQFDAGYKISNYLQLCEGVNSLFTNFLNGAITEYYSVIKSPFSSLPSSITVRKKDKKSRRKSPY